MIVMDIKIDNFFAFKNFHMNMSYPKKIVDSALEYEYLFERPNFRYKKVNILMGANATGKTSIGKMLMLIFNFIDKKHFERLTEKICIEENDASFTVDFVVQKYKLYRVDVRIASKLEEKYKVSDISLDIRSVNITKKDSYESCSKKIEAMPVNKKNSYIEELEEIEGLSWLFEYPSDYQLRDKVHIAKKSIRYVRILEYTLRALDPAIIKVEKITEVEDTYVIRMANRSVVMQEGKIIDNNILSSGTKAGLEIAAILDSILEGGHKFYYCDEKFSYAHSDIEKAFLAVMIQCLKVDDQLFFTTHNTDILDMPLPKHSFTFLKKDSNDNTQPIKCVNASEFLKRNTDSLRCAVDNDLFSVAPGVELIYEIADL